MSKVNVLVVDDASFIRDLVKKGLRDHFPGVQVEEAVNGRKAQTLLTRQAVDLILCDWEMPELSGLELLSWCRQQAQYQAVPLIMITSRSDKQHILQAIEAGVSDYIGKPFSNEQLVNKVKKALGRAGKLEAALAGQPSRGLGNGPTSDSLAVLTGGKPQPLRPRPAPGSPRPAAPPTAPTAAGAAAGAAGEAPRGRGQGQLRLPGGSLACVIKTLSLKDAVLVVRRGEPLPQVLESAVLDLQQGNEVARLNGYLHSIAALAATPDSPWLQVIFRFVDRDPQKLAYLSQLIAQGTPQKHFVPGA